MFAKRETPPPGFIRPEEFAQRVGLSVASVDGLCNEREIVRLDNREFGILDYNEQELLYPNYGVRGIIPEDEVEKLLLCCWATGEESGLRPLITGKVRDFICLPGNEQLLEMVMAAREPGNGQQEKPKKGEYTVDLLSLVYGVNLDSWRNLMKAGVIRHRLMWRGPKTTTMVAISGEIDRLAKECPEKLPRPLQKELARTGRVRPDLKALQGRIDRERQLEERAKDPVLAEFDRMCWRRRRDAYREASMRPAV